MIVPNHQSISFGHECSIPITSESQRAWNELQLGVQLLQQNDLIRARECFERAMLANPRDPVARNCLGIVARTERRLMEAMALFHKAIELRPEFAEAHNNMGNAYRDAGSDQQATECYRRAIAIKPNFAEAHNNLGVALAALGDIEAAICCFEKAIEIQPQYADAYNNLATTNCQLGDLAAATANLNIALQLNGRSPEIHNNLANVLRDSGQLEQARQHYERALQLKPDFAKAYGNLGTLLVDLGHGDEAVALYERAVTLERPPSIPALLNLGNAYRLVGRIEESQVAYERAGAIEPNDFRHRLRVAALCPPAFRSQAEIEACRRRALASWRQLADERREAGAPLLDSRLVEPCFAWQFLDGDLRPLKETYASIFGTRSPQIQRGMIGPPRIGILVTNGHEGLFLRSLAGVLQRISSSHFQLVIICPRSSEAAIRRGIDREFEYVQLPLDFQGAADVIRAAKLRVLYFWEIGTDATNYFLPHLQLAPIQCTSWGVQVTSGIRSVRYYLGSELTEPADAPQHYTEELLLSPTLLTYQVPPQLPSPAKLRSDFGFTSRQRLYVCAQQLGKFHPDFDRFIAEILRQDGNGYFVAVCDKYRRVTEMVQSRIAASMPDVAERVLVLPRLEFNDYLQLLNIADVLLDPPHFGGVNSTYDALALGRPVIALPSRFHRGRYTAACLRKLGTPQLIAQDTDDYVRLAIAWAADRNSQLEFRKHAQQSKAALFRDDLAVREHERLFDEMLQAATRI